MERRSDVSVPVSGFESRRASGRQLRSNRFPEVPRTVVLQEGFLLKQGHLIRSWKKRYFQLYSNRLIYFKTSKTGGAPRGEFPITSRTNCSASAERPFCFRLTDGGSGHVGERDILLQAKDNVEKDIWMSALTATIAAQTQRTRTATRTESGGRAATSPKDARDADDNIASSVVARNYQRQYQDRPQVSVEVIMARNIQREERKGIFAQILVGPGLAQTAAIKHEMEPIWNETFTFDFNRSMRFMQVRLKEHNDVTNHELIGEAVIPLSAAGVKLSKKLWYPLTRRAKEKDAGEILLEVKCNVPTDPILWHIFRQVQAIPCLRLFPPPPTEETMFSPPPLRPFPHEFPPIETEEIEDAAFRVTLKTGVDGQLIYANGVFFLTNYRVIFVPDCRFEVLSSVEAGMYSTAEEHQENLQGGHGRVRSDFFVKARSGSTPEIEGWAQDAVFPLADHTLQVPIRSITAVGSASETKAFGVSLNPPIPGIRIRTKDHRLLYFFFREQRTVPISSMGRVNSLPSSKRSSGKYTKQDIVAELAAAVKSHVEPNELYERIVNWLTRPHPATLPGDHVSTSQANQHPYYQITKTWTEEDVTLMTAPKTDEGGPVERILKRLELALLNPEALTAWAVSIHSDLLRSLNLGREPGIGALSLQNEQSSHGNLWLDSLDRRRNHPVPSPTTYMKNPQFASLEASHYTDSADQNEDSDEDAEDYGLELQEQRNRMEAAKFLRESWSLLNLDEEYMRLGADKESNGFRVSSINENFALCESYPEKILTASGIEDADITLCAAFRSRERIPAVTYVHRRSGAAIFRSSQPKVGMGGARNVHDEALLDKLRTRVNKKAELMIFDMRPKLNASVNKTAGKGFEDQRRYTHCSLDFLGIANIHVMRKSADLLDDSVSGETVLGPLPSLAQKVDGPLGSLWPLAGVSADVVHPYGSSLPWSSLVEQSGWKDHILRILSAVSATVDAVACRGANVLLHCSDGWDRTSQVAALAELVLDPFTRTIPGFCRLVDKHWLKFGHKFHDRAGFDSGLSPSTERSPVFRQFLECVSNLLKWNPVCFEFDDRLLVFLLDHGVYSGWFGTFLFNTPAERKRRELQINTVSIWHPILSSAQHLQNPWYTPTNGLLKLNPSPRLVGLWEPYLYRYYDHLLKSAAQQRQQRQLLSFACEDGHNFESDDGSRSDEGFLTNQNTLSPKGTTPPELRLMQLLGGHNLSEEESAEVTALLQSVVVAEEKQPEPPPRRRAHHLSSVHRNSLIAEELMEDDDGRMAVARLSGSTAGASKDST